MSRRRKYTIEEVSYALAGINEIADEFEPVIFQALSTLDYNLIDQIAQEIYFVAGDPTTRGFYLPRDAEIIRDRKAIIFYAATLFNQDAETVTRDILHEVAHYILKHKSVFDFECGEEHKMEQQEKAADKLVDKWLSKQSELFPKVENR